jgi:hypothetical protein
MGFLCTEVPYALRDIAGMGGFQALAIRAGGEVRPCTNAVRNTTKIQQIAQAETLSTS